MLVWDETDLMTVLEVLPDEESNGVFHIYTVEKDGVKLVITIYQYDGEVGFELINTVNDSSMFSMQLVDCDGVLRKKDKTGEYLEFAPSKCFGGRYDGVESIPYGVRIYVNPSINVALFGSCT